MVPHIETSTFRTQSLVHILAHHWDRPRHTQRSVGGDTCWFLVHRHGDTAPGHCPPLGRLQRRNVRGHIARKCESPRSRVLDMSSNKSIKYRASSYWFVDVICDVDLSKARYNIGTAKPMWKEGPVSISFSLSKSQVSRKFIHDALTPSSIVPIAPLPQSLQTARRNPHNAKINNVPTQP